MRVDVEVDRNRPARFLSRRKWLWSRDAREIGEFGKYSPGNTRESRRPPPLWMLINIHHGRCWCGKPRDQWEPRQRKYCCGVHRRLWWGAINTTWEMYRGHLVRAVACCEACGLEFPKTECKAWWGKYDDYREGEMDVDHIEALALGGSMWDERNHRVLCKDCHIIKTGCDQHKIAARRRAEKQEQHRRKIYGGKTILDYGQE